MAIIKVGAPLSGIRGTLGGITYSANGSGPYVKQWAIPVNPGSSKQYRERGYQSRMPALWAALTEGQRDDWRSFAADPAQELTNSLGEAYYASGFNWYCKCNVRLLRTGRATVDDIPTQARPAAPMITDFRVCVAGSEDDQCVGGTPSGSADYGAGEVYKAFDDNVGTACMTLSGHTTGWIQYTFPVPKNLKRYRIYPYGAASTVNPKDWNFQIYTGGAWESLDSIVDWSFPAMEWVDFYVQNGYTETQYRLNITANNGHVTRMALNEIEMYEADEGASVIIYPEDEFEDSPSYDLVMHVSIGRSEGMGVQYPGYLEVLAMQGPGRCFEHIQTALEAVYGQILTGRSWFARLYRQTGEGLRSAAQTARAVTIS